MNIKINSDAQENKKLKMIFGIKYNDNNCLVHKNCKSLKWWNIGWYLYDF